MAGDYFRMTLQSAWQGCKYSRAFEYSRVLKIFTIFLNAIAEVYLLERRLGLTLCLHPNLNFFQYIFSNFLRSLARVVQQLVRQLVYQVCCTRYQVLFLLWRIEPVIKHCTLQKFQNIIATIVRTWFPISQLPMFYFNIFQHQQKSFKFDL